MKAQFKIAEICVLQNGKVVIGGVAVERLLTRGERGHISSQLGKLEIEIISIGHVDPTPANPNMQMLQIELLNGDPSWLKGTTVEFE